MRRYTDSTVSSFLGSVTFDQTAGFLNKWNAGRPRREKIYISYDSTSKNCQAGDLEIVEFGKAKDDARLPLFNYSLAFDQGNEEPLFYEEYPGSIVDVSQLKHMLDKAEGYGYRDVGFILDRGYFSRDNIACMDRLGYAFVIMVKGRRGLVASLVSSVAGTFEMDRRCFIREHKVYATTVKAKLYPEDASERYFHIYYSVERECREHAAVAEKIEKLARHLERQENKEVVFPDAVRHYFGLAYDSKGKVFLGASEKTDVVNRELGLCGYYAIVTSEKKTAEEALSLYKGRDASEKLFRGDKSYLGNHSLRVSSDEAASAKIFIEFIALIVRNKLYSYLKNAKPKNERKANYMTVPAAIRELEKIEMMRRGDDRYCLYHAVTATQKEILRAFGLDEQFIVERARQLGEDIRVLEQGAIANDEAKEN
jgi:transposase